MPATQPLTRFKAFWCTYCSEEWEVSIPFGCFLFSVPFEKDTFSRLEIREERQGTDDLIRHVVFCPTCGCVSGSTYVEHKPAV